jgi:hypothetical protein
MIVRFEPDAQETVRACAALAADANRPARAQVILFAVFVGVALVARWLVPQHWPVILLFCVVATGLAIGVIQAEHRYQTTKLLAANPHLREMHEIEIAPDCVRSRCSHATTEYSWAGIQKVTENQEFYLLSTGPAAGIAIPKRALTDADDESVRAVIRAAAPDHGAHLARQIDVIAQAT